MDKLIFPGTGNKLIYNCLLLIPIAIVIVVKYNDLFLPFFWDELGVYGLGVAYQYNHTLSLMPGSVPPDISRGHPLLFTFLNACSWRLFGHTMFAAHVFTLLVSLILILVIYRKISFYVSPLAGLVSAVFISVQPLFLGQACLVLPEVMLTLFSILALSACFERKYFQYALFASCAILTKESAIVLPATCLAFSLLQAIMYKKISAGLKLPNLLLTFVPYIVFGIFLMIQKLQYGWYFFPYHIESLKFDLPSFTNHFSAFFDSAFWGQGRYWSEKLLLISIAAALLKNQLSYSNFGKSFLTLVGIFMLAFLCFSSLSQFYMDRYVFAVVMGAGILVGPAVTAITRNVFFALCITLFLSCIAYQHWEAGTFQYDSDLGYRKSVCTVQKAINYVDSVAKNGETIVGPWPVYFAINYPEVGYMDALQIKKTKKGEGSPIYYIYSYPGDNHLSDPEKYNITQLIEFKDGFAITRVYQLKLRDHLAP